MGAFFEAFVNHSDRVFSALLNRAVAATLLILAVCVYRALSPKAPKWTRLFLWALAGLRQTVSKRMEPGSERENSRL